MPKGQPRSPEEIVAEREQQLEKARIRLAQSKLKETPGIQALTDALDNVSAEMLDAEDINDPAFLAYAVEAIEGSTAGQDTQLLASLSLAVEDAQAARKAFAESRKAKPEAEQAQEASA